ncbi:ABC transporter permease [Rhodoferax saidenbachensis]|uniref:ABC-2 type transport system permease protein n=1 Tax=Rhodoferax saidenbachensis TaxID=1484693 RepID=A0ABU1ZKL1_9BURK|nr:ABC transporter permease [Rhodoferax saidenbachensis]MDR7306079.1 ABC-2 type transport system permease protein [Rhodoferax saidenbachensis]
MFFALAKKELLALSRDLHGLAALFLMPMVFIVVMSMALKDVYSPRVQALRYAVVNLDQGPKAESLLTAWSKEHGAPVVPGPEGWQDALRAGDLKYVLQVDAGFAHALEDAPEGEDGKKVHFLAEPGLDQGLFESTRASLMMHVAQLRTESMLAQLKVEGDLAQASELLFTNTLVTAERTGKNARPSSVQQSVPGWLVFGMFFVVASIAGLFVDERSCGALARLRSLGASPVSLLAAKVAPYMLVNGIQAVLMLSVGVWLMPVLGGDGLSLQGISWVALVLVLMSISAAAVSLALAIACLVRTHAQASTLGPILNVLMAALGGIMVPLFVMPEVMQQIAAYSPMNWGLEALLDVLLRGADVSAVLPRVGRLGAFSTLMLAGAYGLFRR